jgi:hypothetical protein
MRERPKTIQRLYEEFEKYCRSDNDFRMCMEEQSQQKKSAKASQTSEREWPNPRNTSHPNPRGIFGLDGKNTQENPNPQADSQSLVPSPPRPPHSNQGGGRRGGRGGGRGRGRGRGQGHNEKRKWYCIFHKENDDHSSNYCPDKKRFEAILEEERKEKESECRKPFCSGLAKSQFWEKLFRKPIPATTIPAITSQLPPASALAITDFPSSKH